MCRAAALPALRACQHAVLRAVLSKADLNNVQAAPSACRLSSYTKGGPMRCESPPNENTSAPINTYMPPAAAAAAGGGPPTLKQAVPAIPGTQTHIALLFSQFRAPPACRPSTATGICTRLGAVFAVSWHACPLVRQVFDSFAAHSSIVHGLHHCLLFYIFFPWPFFMLHNGRQFVPPQNPREAAATCMCSNCMTAR